MLFALMAAGCGGGGQPTQQEKAQQIKDQIGQIQRYIAQRQDGPQQGVSFQIDGNDPAFRMFCHSNNPAARAEGRQALLLEIRSSPGAPAHVHSHKFAHELKGACAGPPKTITPRSK